MATKLIILVAFFLGSEWLGLGQELAPPKIIRRGGLEIGHYSERTVTVAIQVDREGAELLSFTVKQRPFERIQSSTARARIDRSVGQLEVRLHNQSGRWITVPVQIPGFCLEHSLETPSHLEGDTVRHHREALLVELPELPGFDQIEVAVLPLVANQGSARRIIGTARLTTGKFTPAGTGARYDDLAFADPQGFSLSPAAAPPPTSGAVHWPEEYGDTNRYTVYGNEAEATNRINIVLVPDGYTYGQKALLQAHASNLVTHFRAQTPFREHDTFVNYTLVYAYSTEDGTDQCDCGIVRDTAMNTSFPYGDGVCGSDANRLLDYGSVCDNPTNAYYWNVTGAEMRAPVWDYTIILVNTPRYGGSGGYRAVYAAGNSSAIEIALHEIGHTIARLTDEYGGIASCGNSAGEFNTSANSVNGAWPEWITDLGPPRQGAEFYNLCVYRPTLNCKMRTLNVAYCPVCVQRWATSIFGHRRIVPTAPAVLEGPATPLTVTAGVPTPFSVKTRMSTLVSNTITWSIHGLGSATNIVASNTPAYTHTFTTAGDYVVACEVVADVNFVKPSKNSGNYDLITWNVTVQPGVARPSIQILSTPSQGSYELVLRNLTEGGQYFVESAANLLGNNWSTRTNFTATGNVTNILVSSTNASASFYRVRRAN